ncbi:MAG: SPW repeat protein [bacterium]|nr:SPW repeat protein [bacterium]
MKWLSWATMGLGLWLVVSPFVLGYWEVSSALWSQIIAGVLLGLIALWQIVETEDDNI